MTRIQWLDPDDAQAFPPVERALAHPEGLLAAGGDLSVERLLAAYRRGIFPWFEQDQPILWWSPNPRAVLFPEQLHITRSLRKTLRNTPYRVCFDSAFRQTMLACAAPRREGAGTWITDEMVEAYCRLHAHGAAHSIEVWNAQDTLVGGLYGVAIGQVFFGESMFSRERDTSKIALAYLSAHLQHWGYSIIDCQQASDHIMRMGAQCMAREAFIRHIHRACEQTGNTQPWTVLPELSPPP